jgi:hypothetical protein
VAHCSFGKSSGRHFTHAPPQTLQPIRAGVADHMDHEPLITEHLFGAYRPASGPSAAVTTVAAIVTPHSSAVERLDTIPASGSCDKGRRPVRTGPPTGAVVESSWLYLRLASRLRIRRASPPHVLSRGDEVQTRGYLRVLRDLRFCEQSHKLNLLMARVKPKIGRIERQS